MSQSNQRIVVYGGHGRVVADAADAAGFKVLGFLDDTVPIGSHILAWRVLGSIRSLEGNGDVAVAHGIGSNLARERVTQSLGALGVSLTSVTHPSAVLSKHARVGSGAVVLALGVLNPGAEIGAGAIVKTAAIIEHDVIVGDFAHVASNAALGGSARIDRLALLGTCASVLPGRSIGECSIVGAGATHNVPPDSVVARVPARVVRHIES